MIMIPLKCIPFLLLTLFIVGCSTPLSKQNAVDSAEALAHYTAITKPQLTPKLDDKQPSRVFTINAPNIFIRPFSAEEQERRSNEWLRSITISLTPSEYSTIPASEILRMFRANHINIVANIPLDAYQYGGLGVSNIDAITALTVFMGAMGLDFTIDNERQLVTIEPIKPKTWMLNIGNRSTSFKSGSSGSSGGTSSSSTSGTTASASTTGKASTSGTSNSTTSGTTGIGINSSDNVWDKLKTEIEQRLTVLIPYQNLSGSGSVPSGSRTNNDIMPPSQAPGSSARGSNSDAPFYTEQKVGRLSINPETGSITVQAPTYILKSLDEYLTKVQDMYNTSITFEGEVITITTSDSRSEGIDWSAFNSVAGVQTVMQNNILGGAIITPAVGGNAVVNALTIANASLPGANTLFGITSASKKFAAFNAFMSSIGELNIKDRPLVTTTSGAPVQFQNYITRHYQQYEQTAASGGTTGGSAVATNTIDIPYDVGMSLSLNPRYDVYSGLVRTQFSVVRTMINGWEDKVNPISTGTTVQILNTKIPAIARTMNDGELLLRDGDLVVVGGLTEDSQDNSDSGITGLIDGPLKSLTGKGTRSKTNTTYYFALRVSIKKM